MAIKISGNTVIDDSQNITATGSATIDGPISLGSVALPSAGTARIYSRDTDNSLYLQTSSGNRISLLDGSQNSMASFEPTTLKFFIGNTERARIDSSGNMGLGTESPSSLLHVSGQDATINVSAADGSLSAMTSNTSQRIAFQGGNTEIGLFKDSSDNYSYVIGTYQGSIDIPLVFRTGNRAERMRLDSSGRLLVNHTADTAPAGYASKLQLCDTSYQGSSMLLRRDENSDSSPTLIFAKTRSSSKGGSTVVQDGDNTGAIMFFGGDGNDADAQTAYILSSVDGTPGNNDMPGRLTFHTTADGATASTERMRIDSSGRVLLGTTTEGQQNADNLTIADSGHCGLTIRSGTTSGGAIYFSDATSGGGEYDGYIEYNHPSRFMRFGAAQDEAMRLDSSGNATLTGTITANGGYALSQLTELT